MRKKTYYPAGQGDQIDWNNNIITELPNYVSELGLTGPELQAILDDCAMEVFLLSNVGPMADTAYATLHGFADAMEHSPLNSPPIPLPVLTKWPGAMPTMVPPGIAARRSAWVARAKNTAGYNKETIGRTLRLEAPDSPWVPNDYVAELKSAVAIGHEQVQVQIGKGGGEITAARLMMRRKGETFALVAQFTARSIIDTTALKDPGTPEVREYQLIALKNDVVVGQPSPTLTVTVS